MSAVVPERYSRLIVAGFRVEAGEHGTHEGRAGVLRVAILQMAQRFGVITLVELEPEWLVEPEPECGA